MTTLTFRKGSETRQRIIGRALEFSGRLGLEGLSIGTLASDLGLSKSGLFAHFKSKEQLQLDVLDAAAERFTVQVFAPALKRARGEQRLGAVFENWLAWIRSEEIPGGCLFLSSAMEWDDREGAVRDAIVNWFERLDEGLQRAVRLGVTEGQFKPDLDCVQFACDMHAIVLKYHLDTRLLRKRGALVRARVAFQRLLKEARLDNGEAR